LHSSVSLASWSKQDFASSYLKSLTKPEPPCAVYRSQCKFHWHRYLDWELGNCVSGVSWGWTSSHITRNSHILSLCHISIFDVIKLFMELHWNFPKISLTTCFGIRVLNVD
jgi:hypothetical protein